MPNRIIKESICTSDTIDQMSWFEECLWYRLIVNCDDYGRIDARLAVLKAKLFPLKERITLKDVSNALTRLADMGCVVLYESFGRPYLYLPTWEVHQTIRAKKSKCPEPTDNLHTHEIMCKQMQADAPVIQSNPNPNPKEGADTPRRFTPPTADEVKAYCTERGNNVDSEAFCDFYISKGWKVGNQPMKDWKGAVRTWEKRNKKDEPPDNYYKRLN